MMRQLWNWMNAGQMRWYLRIGVVWWACLPLPYFIAKIEADDAWKTSLIFYLWTAAVVLSVVQWVTA